MRSKKSAGEFGLILKMSCPFGFGSAQGESDLKRASPDVDSQLEGDTKLQKKQCVHIRFLFNEEGPTGDSQLSPSVCLEQLKSTSFLPPPQMIVIVSSRTAREAEALVVYISNRETEYRSLFVMPPMKKAEPAYAQIICSQYLFDITGIEVQWVPLTSLSLREGKKDFAMKAEFRLWMTAMQADFPKHPPFEVNETYQLLQGSSTYMYMLKHFNDFEQIKVPVLIAPLKNPENSFDERLVLAAWHGQLDRISKLVQEYASRDQGGGEERLPLGTKPVARFGNTTALQKAEALGYTDVVEALQQESKCVIS